MRRLVFACWYAVDEEEMRLFPREREPSRWPHTQGTGVLQARLVRAVLGKDSRPPPKMRISLAFPRPSPLVPPDRVVGLVALHDELFSSAEVIPLFQLQFW